jgi:hypothetical protein
MLGRGRLHCGGLRAGSTGNDSAPSAGKGLGAARQLLREGGREGGRRWENEQVKSQSGRGP